MQPPIRIVLADDHDLMRTTIEQILQQNNHLELVASCNNGNDAIEKTLLLQPEFLLIDMVMKPINGLQVAEKIKKSLPNTKIIAFSSHSNPGYARAFLELGTNGFLVKGSMGNELLTAIEAVNNGNIYLCSEIKALLQ